MMLFCLLIIDSYLEVLITVIFQMFIRLICAVFLIDVLHLRSIYFDQYNILLRR